MSNVERLNFAPYVNIKLLMNSTFGGNRSISGASSDSPERDIRRMLHGKQFTQ